MANNKFLNRISILDRYKQLWAEIIIQAVKDYKFYEPHKNDWERYPKPAVLRIKYYLSKGCKMSEALLALQDEIKDIPYKELTRSRYRLKESCYNYWTTYELLSDDNTWECFGVDASADDILRLIDKTPSSEIDARLKKFDMKVLGSLSAGRKLGGRNGVDKPVRSSTKSA